MKFNDGYWQLREGFAALYPRTARAVEGTPRSMTVYGPTRPVADRGGTLNLPVITVDFRSPMTDVISVTVTHLAGGRPRTPEFALSVDPESPVTVLIDDQEAVLSAGALSARIGRDGPWGFDFVAGGRVLTSSGGKCAGVTTDGTGRTFAHDRLSLGVGESVFGLGERFGPVVKNGQVVDIWNADGGTSSEQAYKNVPFYLTDAGYGVFVDSPDRVSFEVGSEVVSRVQFSVPGQTLRYHVIHGPTPKDVLRRYTALTGRPALPPLWSFGLWLSTSFTTDYDEVSVAGLLDGMAERDLPLSVFHFDAYWMREFRWCDFEWDPAVSGDPPAMLARLHDRGLRVCVWINPYIAERSRLFAEGAERGYLVRTPAGDVWQTDQWQAGMALVDFTNPEARRWYSRELGALVDSGVDCLKADFGERIPTDVVWHDGSDPERMHNYYTHLYNETVFETLRERRGEGEAVLFARSATAGGQQFPVHWGGDSESTYPSMAETLRGGLSLAASGFGFWSHDIGGFEGTPDPGLFKRWVAFGMLSSHSRLHGSDSFRVPWAFDEEAVTVLRLFTKLKMRLMPYLWRAAVEVHTDGVPVLRPMFLEFPDDPGATGLDRQYLLGPDLLVAPVLAEDGAVAYYVPAGRWTALLTGATVDGPGWVRERHDVTSIPLLVRPGAVLATSSRTDRPDHDHTEGLILEAYQLSDGAERVVEVAAPDGSIAARFVVERVGPVVRARLTRGSATSWGLRVVDGDAAAPAQATAAVDGIAEVRLADPDGGPGAL